jgi:hypothetical protein
VTISYEAGCSAPRERSIARSLVIRNSVNSRGARVDAAGWYGACQVAVQAGMRPTRAYGRRADGRGRVPKTIDAVVPVAPAARLGEAPAVEAVDTLERSELVAEAVVAFTIRGALTVPDARGSRVVRHVPPVFPRTTVL